MSQIVITLVEERSQQMKILKHMGLLTDENKPLVKKALKSCKSEIQMSNLLYGVKHGTETIDEMLVRKGFYS